MRCNTLPHTLALPTLKSADTGIPFASSSHESTLEGKCRPGKLRCRGQPSAHRCLFCRPTRNVASEKRWRRVLKGTLYKEIQWHDDPFSIDHHTCALHIHVRTIGHNHDPFTFEGYNILLCENMFQKKQHGTSKHKTLLNQIVWSDIKYLAPKSWQDGILFMTSPFN